jgi:tetratricopeptide (TPR) repeat protein
MVGDTHRFHLDRHRAGAALAPEHVADFQRLLKDLCYGSRFQLLICECRDERLRETLIERLDEVLSGHGLRPSRLRLGPEDPADVPALERALAELAADHDAIHITGADLWLSQPRWRAMNIRREALAEQAPARLLLWLGPEQVARMADLVPDIWAWRAGLFAFPSLPDKPRPAPEPYREQVDNRSLAERSRRISELRAYLDSNPPPPDELRLPLLDELAELYRVMGQLDEALRIRTEDQLPVYERLGDIDGIANVRFRRAQTRFARGDHETEGRNSIDEDLSAALAILRKLGRPDGIGAVALLRARLLSACRQTDEARAMLDEAETAYTKLGHTEGLDEIAQLRHGLE